MTITRALIFALVASFCLSAAGQAAHAAVHDGDMESLAECVLCSHSDRQDDAVPAPAADGLALPLSVPVAKAFAAKAAVVPTVTVTPPGRAPPLSI